jgi:opacity protein-like surface antigen
MNTSKLTVAAVIATALLTSSAFAQSLPRDYTTVPQNNSSTTTGAGSLGYNVSQANPDR